MPLWTQAFKDGFRLALRARLLLLLPLAVDLALLPLVVPLKATAPEFTLPVAFPSVSQVRGSAGALPFFPVYLLPPLGNLTIGLFLLILVGLAYLASGYVGQLEMLRRRRTDEGFFASANRAFARILAFFAVTSFLVLVSAPLLSGEVGVAAAAWFVFAALLVSFYFLFLTPFVIVVDNARLSMGLRNSIELATREYTEVVPYCLGYAAIAVLASVAFHLIGWHPVGLLLFPAIYAFIGTGLVGSTLYLYAGLRPKEPTPAPSPEPEPLEEAVPA